MRDWPSPVFSLGLSFLMCKMRTDGPSNSLTIYTSQQHWVVTSGLSVGTAMIISMYSKNLVALWKVVRRRKGQKTGRTLKNCCIVPDHGFNCYYFLFFSYQSSRTPDQCSPDHCNLVFNFCWLWVKVCPHHALLDTKKKKAQPQYLRMGRNAFLLFKALSL